jgi:NAD(P)-dependent dehydrogenase (short-subunit alcohol dehydrogenase family)
MEVTEMLTPENSVVDAMLQSVRRATDTNLKLQQDLLLGWTRFWPGFTGRGEGRAGSLPNIWSEGVIRLAQAQRDFVTHQYDVAIGMLEAGQNGNEPVEPAVAPAAAKPKAADVPVASPPKAVAAPQAAASQVAAPKESLPEVTAQVSQPAVAFRNIQNKVALVTGAASGIGQAVAKELAARGAKSVLLVDRSDAAQEVAKSINDSMGRTVAEAKVGDTTDEAFRKRVFNDAQEKYGVVSICVPAAGITRDALSVRIDKETGKADIYPVDTFRQVTEVNLIAPIYWGVEMVARIAEDRRQRGLKRWEPEELIQGVVVFLGSVSSQGNKGQISYAVAKAGLEGAAATLTKEAIFHGVRCGIIHPGFTDTPMARALGEEFLEKYVLPYTQLRRLITVEEIADAICFMINNSAVSGELWADAGWHPPA